MFCRCSLALLTLTLAVTVGSHPPLAVGADWPQWRGPARDGISKETGLLKEWPKDGLTVRWKRTDIGTGYSSPSIVAGKVFVQTTKDKDEFALCLEEKSGKDVWKVKIGGVGPNKGPQYPGTRSSPTVDGDLVYCLASDGELACLTTDGKPKWSKNIAKLYKGSVGSWAYTESVLIDGKALICTPGGEEATLLALDKTTGEEIWKCAVPGGDTADYASIMPLEAGGVKQYVQYMRKGVVAVDAKTGKFLWRYAGTLDFAANMLTPVTYQDKVYVSSRGGGGMVEIKADGDKLATKQVFLDKALNGGIGGALLMDGHLYGTTGQALFCVEFATGKILWQESSTGNASVCYADGRLYVRSHQTGDVFLVEPNAKEFVEKGRIKQPDRSKMPAWPHPVIANGGLYLRDMDTLVCFDVSAKK